MELKKLRGVVSYQAKNPSGTHNLDLSLYVDPNQCFYGVMACEQVLYFPVPQEILSITKFISPDFVELDHIRLHILEGFCLQYMLLKGFSFKEIVTLDQRFEEGFARKFEGFNDYWNHFFLFAPNDITQAIREIGSVSEEYKKDLQQGIAEFEQLKAIARGAKHNNTYYAEKWLKFKATITNENDKNLAETAAQIFKGEPLKNIAYDVWQYDGKRPTGFVSDKRADINTLAELHDLPPLPKNPRGAKKKHK